MKHFLWIDLEMSGLDVEKCKILEVAAIVTDLELNEKDSFHKIVYQPPEVLDAMDEWCTKQHGRSGLTEAVKDGEPLEKVDQELVLWMKKYFPRKEPAVIAGNSVGNDKLFIDRYMPELSKRLHYRILDVSSWKIIFKERFNKQFPKSDLHRAVDDIRESIAEMSYYLKFIDEDALG